MIKTVENIGTRTKEEELNTYVIIIRKFFYIINIAFKI